MWPHNHKVTKKYNPSYAQKEGKEENVANRINNDYRQLHMPLLVSSINFQTSKTYKYYGNCSKEDCGDVQGQS